MDLAPIKMETEMAWTYIHKQDMMDDLNVLINFQQNISDPISQINPQHGKQPKFTDEILDFLGKFYWLFLGFDYF